jgi:subtilase family serine protease
MSIVFLTLDYQIAANIMKFESDIRDRAGGHFIPDIASMVGYKNSVLNRSPNEWFVGTSCSTPLYTGPFAALCGASGRPFGFLNSTLYQLGNMVIRDATKISSPYFNAGIEYDPATGWCSIDGMKMKNSLAELLFPHVKYVYVIADKSNFGLAENKRDVSR